MANWGKTAGIVSGLAVGLTGGVFLAAMNPILPHKDTTSVAQAPAQHSASDSDAAIGADTDPQNIIPKLSMVDATTPATDAVAALPEQPVAVDAPVSVEPASIAPKTADVAALDTTPQSPGETELAMVLPETQNAPKETAQTLLTSESQPEPQPALSTTPADPVALDQPAAETNSPDVLDPDLQDVSGAGPDISPSDSGGIISTAPPVQQVAGLNDKTLFPQVDSKPQVRTAAKQGASLSGQPILAKPNAPDETTQETEVATLLPQDQPNKSGTFQTVGSRLPTVDGGSDHGISALGTGGGSARIPRIGGQSADDSDKIIEPVIGAAWANANDFMPTGKPLLAIVLLDTGNIADQLPKLSGLGLPLAIAISLDQPDAAGKARAYRNAGFEVLALSPRDVKLSLSGGQSDEQVAELLDQYFAIMPEAVGLIDRPDANLQKDQRLVRAVINHFAETGHGLITYAGGLNAAPRMAAQRNLPSGVISRILDGAGESDGVMTGYLNRAARQARSKGSAIVLATPSRETMAAVLNWSLSTNARAVTLAPVSAVLIDHGQ